MTDAPKLDQVIIDSAAELFMRQGYAATSIKQIAEAAGCTNAALYYYFKGGKHDILQAVMQAQLPDMAHIIEKIQDATSLHHAVELFVGTMRADADNLLARLRWLMVDFPNMGPEERTLFYEKHLALHRGLADVMGRFMTDPAAADWRAWMLISMAIGYGHLFISMAMRDYHALPEEALIPQIADLFSQDDN